MWCVHEPGEQSLGGGSEGRGCSNRECRAWQEVGQPRRAARRQRCCTVLTSSCVPAPQPTVTPLTGARRMVLMLQAGGRGGGQGEATSRLGRRQCLVGGFAGASPNSCRTARFLACPPWCKHVAFLTPRSPRNDARHGARLSGALGSGWSGRSLRQGAAKLAALTHKRAAGGGVQRRWQGCGRRYPSVQLHAARRKRPPERSPGSGCILPRKGQQLGQLQRDRPGAADCS